MTSVRILLRQTQPILYYAAVLYLVISWALLFILFTCCGFVRPENILRGSISFCVTRVAEYMDACILLPFYIRVDAQCVILLTNPLQVLTAWPSSASRTAVAGWLAGACRCWCRRSMSRWI